MSTMLLLCLSALVAVATVSGDIGRHSRGVVNYRNKDSAEFGMLRQLSAHEIVSEIPEVSFTVFNHNDSKRRRLQGDDDGVDDDGADGDDGGGDDDDDEIIPTIPQVDFSIVNDVDASTGDVCEIGCEGDYDGIRDVLLALEDADYELFFTVQGRYAVAAGTIYDNFLDRVRELSETHPEVDTLILVECPGSANDDAMTAGSTLVHQLGYQTCVPSDGHTASGGTDLFTAGAKRYATPGSRVGIHSWLGADGTVASDLPRDDPAHDLYLKFADDTCIPQDFYWLTLTYGLPMHYITEDEFEDLPYLRDCSGECFGNGGGDGVDMSITGGTTDVDGDASTGALDPARVELFFEAIDAELDRQRVRGAAYAFRGPGMDAPLLGSFGQVSSSPDSPSVDIDTAFILASVSKPFVGAAMAVLIDQGLLDLDWDICDVVGGPTLDGAVNTACRNPSFPDTVVTWRMLINHRSSLNRDVPDPDDSTNAAYGPTGVNYPGLEIVGNPECPIDDVEQFFEDLFVDKPTETTVGNIGYSVNWFDIAEATMGGVWNETLEPGERNVYSNIAVAYLASLIQKLTGESFVEFCATNIFAKAGMNHTAWFRRDLPENTTEAVPMASYDEESGTWEDIGHYCYGDYANGQLHSSVSDLATYADLMLSYGIDILWSNTTALEHVFGCQENDEDGTPLLDDDLNCEQALSWFHFSNAKRDAIGEDAEPFQNLDWTNGIQHDGGDAGVSTEVLILPEAGTYVIVITNANDGQASSVANAVRWQGMALLSGEPPVDPASYPTDDDGGNGDDDDDTSVTASKYGSDTKALKPNSEGLNDTSGSTCPTFLFGFLVTFLCALY